MLCFREGVDFVFGAGLITAICLFILIILSACTWGQMDRHALVSIYQHYTTVITASLITSENRVHVPMWSTNALNGIASVQSFFIPCPKIFGQLLTSKVLDLNLYRRQT